MNRPLTHRPIDPALLRRIYRQPEPVRFVVRRERPTWLERFTLFMAVNGEALSFWFAMLAVAALVGVVGGAFLAGAR